MKNNDYCALFPNKLDRLDFEALRESNLNGRYNSIDFSNNDFCVKVMSEGDDDTAQQVQSPEYTILFEDIRIMIRNGKIFFENQSSSCEGRILDILLVSVCKFEIQLPNCAIKSLPVHDVAC